MSDPTSPGSVPPSAIPTPPLGSPRPPAGGPTLPDFGAGQPSEATTQMPVTGAGGPPPITPPGTGFGGPLRNEPPTPWYKKPGPIIAAFLVVAAIGGVLAWLLISGGDDEEQPVATPESSLLVLEVTDETGAPVDVGFIVGVGGPAEAPADYTWIQPDTAVAGELGGDSTGSDGRVEFEWEPAGLQSDPITWPATVTIIQQVPAGWTPPGPIVDCVLARPDTQDTTVAMAVTVDVPDPAADQIVNYTFPNYQFLAGDTVTCGLTIILPVETSTTSTTIEESTTTSTTVEDTTTTQAPATSVPVVTVPPQPEATLWDVIVASPDLSELRALVELAGLQDVLSDPDQTLTLLAPSNQAITTAASGVGAPDFANPSIVESVLLTHVDNLRALLFTQILALDPPEFVVVNPGPHDVDAASNPPTIGGAQVLVADIEAANGVLHVIDRVLIPQTLPD